MSTVYWGVKEVCTYIGVKTVRSYRLPEPDIFLGTGPNAARGWLPETIKTWHANRPGRGNWGRHNYDNRPPKPAE